MTPRREGAAGRLFFWKKLLSYETYGVEIFLELVSSVELSQRGAWLMVVLVAIEALPVESKPPAAVGEHLQEWETRLWPRSAVLDHDVIPARESGGFGHHAETGAKSSVRLEPFVQYSYPRASLELLWRRPPCARESSCLFTYLPPWQDVAAERHALGVLNADPYFSNLPKSRLF